MTRHRKTDPRCVYFVMPRTRLGLWWFNRKRGYGCSVCGYRRLNAALAVFDNGE